MELDGYYPGDIADYESRGGLPNVTVTNVLLDGFLGTPGPNNFEVALDIELALAMAPGLSELIVYEAGPQGTADSALTKMADDNLAKQLSCSWLWNPEDDPIADQVFQQFAAQGQSFCTAAGDADAYAGAVSFPADNPDITVVGATALSTTSGGLWSSETVWNDGNGKGGGGGISRSYTIPTWQQGINMSANGGSTTNRNIPDVAIVGYNVSIIYNNGATNPFYGTSCSAPLWAAVIALANQQAANYGQAAVGFINPAIYGVGQAAGYSACFHDITTGNNTNSANPTRFFACPGYDLCSGWGSPAGQALIDALAPPSFLVVFPPAGLNAAGPPGGPFNPATQSCYVSNHGPATLAWSLAGASPWLNVTPVSGTLPASGSAAPVTVSFSAAAGTLASGAYSTPLTFTDENTGLTRTLPFTLQVSRSLAQNGGFEAGNFSSWTLSGNSVYNVVSASLIAPHTGEYAAAFGQSGSLAYLSQTVATTPGAAYLLSFWLSNPTAGTPNQFEVNWNTNLSSTNTLLSQTNLGPFNWTNEQFIVTATGASSVLQFGFRDDPRYLGLDDVSLVPLQPPVAANAVLQRGQSCGVKVRAATLLAGGSDPNNGVLTLVSAGPTSTNGGTVVVNGGWVFYSSASDSTNTDAFPYVIADSDGLQATGWVSITVPVDLSQSQNIVASNNLGNGASLIQFQGIPGYTYTIEYTESLQNPVWQPLGTSTADATGVFAFTDAPGSGSPPRFYRSSYP